MCLQGHRKEVDILSFCHFCTLWPPSLPCTGGRNRWVLLPVGRQRRGGKSPLFARGSGVAEGQTWGFTWKPPCRGCLPHAVVHRAESGWLDRLWGRLQAHPAPPPPHLLPTWLRPRRLLPGETCTQHGILGSDLQPLTQCRCWEVRLQTRQTGFKPQLCHPLDRELGVIPLTSYGVMLAPALRISTRIK